MKERIDPFYRHQLAIAKRTLSMPEAMVGVMGGMNKEEAQKFMDKHKEGERKKARENRHAREDAYRSVGLVRGKDSMGRTLWE